MALQARIGDQGLGVCPCHDSPVQYITIFVSGADRVFTNDPISAIIGSVGISTCGHPTVALTGAKTVTKQYNQAHRLGDTGANCGPYVVITSSSNVDVE